VPTRSRSTSQTAPDTRSSTRPTARSAAASSCAAAATCCCKAGPTCEPGTIQDSFGDNGGSADGGASGDGSAADGAPIVGGRVRVTDTTGREATATTDTRGYFRVRLTGMVPPLLVRVTRPDGVVRHSISFQPLRTNGYIFMAVTGLTDMIASEVSTAINDEGGIGAASLTPARLARMAATVWSRTRSTH
jgi:hypothetical protein